MWVVTGVGHDPNNSWNVVSQTEMSYAFKWKTGCGGVFLKKVQFKISKLRVLKYSIKACKLCFLWNIKPYNQYLFHTPHGCRVLLTPLSQCPNQLVWKPGFSQTDPVTQEHADQLSPPLLQLSSQLLKESSRVFH